MTGVEVFDPVLDVVGEVLVRTRHVRPHRVASHGRAFDAAQHGAKWRLLPPRRVAMPGILIMIRRGVEVLVDESQARMVRVDSQDWMVLQLAEAGRKRD